MHPGYKFEVAFIVVRAMGYIQKCLVTYLKIVGFESKVLFWISMILKSESRGIFRALLNTFDGDFLWK